jgi:hypothetical protein
VRGQRQVQRPGQVPVGGQGLARLRLARLRLARLRLARLRLARLRLARLRLARLRLPGRGPAGQRVWGPLRSL